MMKVLTKCEYGEIISRYFQHSFPKAIKMDKVSLLEILTDIFVGTKEYRYGPKPKVESLYTIRQTLMKAMEKNLPIPIIVPWGGVKSNSQLSVDIGEVSAIKQIILLDEMVKQFYPAGILVNIRIEDLGAEWIYRDSGREDSIEKYSSDMVKLVDFLKGDSNINAIRESRLMDTEQYFTVSQSFSSLINEVVTILRAHKGLDITNIPAYARLVNAGWKGYLPQEQQDYYIDRYKQLYPGRDKADYIQMFSDYMGGAKARYDLNGRALPNTEVGSSIQVTFVPPVPGAPVGMFNNTLYYRTIPESCGRSHIAPWRGKGYLEIVDDKPIPKITNDKNIIHELEENSVILKNDVGEEFLIRCDYRITNTVLPQGLIV